MYNFYLDVFYRDAGEFAVYKVSSDFKNVELLTDDEAKQFMESGDVNEELCLTVDSNSKIDSIGVYTIYTKKDTNPKVKITVTTKVGNSANYLNGVLIKEDEQADIEIKVSYGQNLEDFIPENLTPRKKNTNEMPIKKVKNSQNVGTDPFLKQQNILNLMDQALKVQPKEIEKIPERKHRTLVVIYMEKNSSFHYKERTARFVASLNLPDTIKADVVSVHGDIILEGVVYEIEEPETWNKPWWDLNSLKAAYLQIIEVREGNGTA